jgi:hypothetical protein
MRKLFGSSNLHFIEAQQVGALVRSPGALVRSPFVGEGEKE